LPLLSTLYDPLSEQLISVLGGFRLAYEFLGVYETPKNL